MRLLWSPARPGLGALVDAADDVTVYADTRWQLFSSSGPREFNLFLLIVSGVIALAFGLPFTLRSDADELHEQAWSPAAQSVVGVAVAGVFLVQWPRLLGIPDGGLLWLAAGLSCLVPLGVQAALLSRSSLR